MAAAQSFEIFLVATPGLEEVLLEEARDLGFRAPRKAEGGVRIEGKWHDVWRANLELRCATRVLARIGSFPADHLAKLDRAARNFAWNDHLRSGAALRVEVTCRKSRIYHAGAAKQRIEKALIEEFGAVISEDADLCIKARIEKDVVTLSIDTSGESLHKRGHKEAVGKAPLRETLAASFLRMCGYRGDEPLIDPMCGSGTLVIEAAEMALGLKPGRDRKFAFELLKSFDAEEFHTFKSSFPRTRGPRLSTIDNAEILSSRVRGNDGTYFFGSDRNNGAIEMATANAKRSGVAHLCTFQHHAISALKRPDSPTGLIFINPPYGTRVGEKKKLFDLYAAMGKVLGERFSGWRVGLVTTDDQLAKATKLNWSSTSEPILHGGLRVKVLQANL